MDLPTTVVTDIETLQKKSEDFDFANPPINPSELAHHLVKVMYEYNGLGLSAIQIGLPYRVFVMRGPEENLACFNPKIVMPSSELALLEEGCLSFPGLCVKIKRPRHIRARFTGPNGETVTHVFADLTARIFQHELDHLNGRLFFQDCNRHRLEMAVRGTKYESMGLLRYARSSRL